jgi:hypothetical protein
MKANPNSKLKLADSRPGQAALRFYTVIAGVGC